MAKSEIENLPAINVIIAGHIDHGKTTLLHKLSGKWTDTHSEELKRGITIKLGYADTILYKKDKTYNISKEGTPERYVSFIDAPGHEMLMATMLSGAAIVDAAILVVAANEGIKPQTSEHLMALQAKNIKDIIIVQNKIDLVPPEKAKENFKLLKEKLKGTIAENAPIIPVSAQQEVNIEEIWKKIAELKIPKRNLEDTPIFLVARSFDINKPGTKPSKLHGTVLGGTLKSGVLKPGDLIEIKPGISKKEQNQITYKTVKTRISSLRKGTQIVSVLTPGGSAAIETELDMSLGKTDSFSGCAVSLENSLPEITNKLKIKFEMFSQIFGSKDKQAITPLKTPEMVMLSVNTSVTIGNVTRISGNEAEISLKIPIVPFKESKLGIARNINNHWRLIGHGKVL